MARSQSFRNKLNRRSKSKKNAKLSFDWLAIGLIFGAILSFYCVLFPDLSGLWGRKIAQFLGWLSGGGRFLIPILMGYAGFWFLFHGHKGVGIIKFTITLGIFWLGMVFFSLVGNAVWGSNYGGVLGFIGHKFLNRVFGTVGAWIVTAGGMAVLTCLMFGLTPSELLIRFKEMLVHDWQEWKKNQVAPPRKEKKSPIVSTKPLPNNPSTSNSPKISGDSPSTPLIKQEEAPAPLTSNNKKISSKSPLIVERNSSGSSSNTASFPDPEDSKVKEIKPNENEKRQEGLIKPYESPSLEIFETFKKSEPISKEELTERAKLLETTLMNFNIQASVVEIHPGPVITRYDLEPAPGVKVSSISSRTDDIALAMKSTGIRVLAPIPGKGAVGVEIPNPIPETVGLREMLARPEFANHKSPLAFILGKSVSGDPVVVDLASMPHLLVAGATGSGKSVVVHSMISSILYRMGPDRVKFTLIDPKRLELPSYSLIPHLYDPRNSPINAEVITNSKHASKALTRLVKVMEYRYDLFAKANVRNIESYNQKRKQAGLDPEYYLVVIIDELADLMLTSPKDVEDSIQRLAQMARAVGIHLVLATQRPSVDVITGVIKANLPSRIALRVSSSTDSRVIVDVVGAESLLGKGDMLYLPPASPEPVRVQGAFVSEKEVENLVNHVKQFGTPAYDDLFSSGSALEFAVEDKKEMKDLIDAIRLVLQRKRVSQDLLKAHFGSSARATNILSLLEVKELISKPEGSNRWDINFDAMEEFIAKVANVPEGELMS